MYYNVLKSIKYRQKYNFRLKSKWFFKMVLKNHLFTYSLYHYNILRHSNISITKLRNRCIINGKARSNYTKFRLSRFFIKEYSRSGKLNGITKK